MIFGTHGGAPRWLAGRRLYTKIVLIVAVLAICLAGTGLLSLARLRTAQRTGDEVYNEAMLPATQLVNLKLLLLAKRASCLRHANAPDLTDKTIYEEEFRHESADLAAALDRFPVARGSADAARIARLRELGKEFDEIILTRYMPASRDFDAVTVQRAHDVASPLVDESERILDQMIAEQDARARAIHDRVRTSYETSVAIVMTAVIGALLLGLGLARYIALLIVRPLRRVEWVADGLAAGDLTRSTGVRADDEVGRLARALDEAVRVRRELEDELVTRNAALTRIARTDMLTDLHNRRSLVERLTEFGALAGRYGTELSVALVDLDHFKAVNDVHGHDAGDAVLQEMARRLAAVARMSDVVGRWGGEEFLMLLPNTGDAGALVVADRLLAMVRAEPVRLGDGTALPVTASVGVAAGLTDGVTGLLKRADDALYAAKKAGRDRAMGLISA